MPVSKKFILDTPPEVMLLLQNEAKKRKVSVKALILKLIESRGGILSSN